MKNEIDLKKKNDEKFDKLEKEIKDLKNEIKDIKKEHKKEIDKLKKEVENLKEENEKMNQNLYDISLSFENLKENDINNLNNMILFILVNLNFDFFKNMMESRYEKIKDKNAYSALFQNKYKSSYSIIVELLYEHSKGKNGKDKNKIIEYKGGKNYSQYNKENWNWFLITNVIYQMIYSDEIELNQNGVEQTIEKIYKLMPMFKIYKNNLNEAKKDIKDYIEDYQICEVIKAIKNIICPKNKSLFEGNNILLLKD